MTEDEVDAIKHRLRIATGATSHKDVASPVVVPSTESSPKPPPQSKMAVRTDPPTALPSADDDDPFESGLAAVRYENVMGRRPDPRKAAVRKPDAGD